MEASPVAEAPQGSEPVQAPAGKLQQKQQKGAAQNLAAFRWLLMSRDNVSGTVRAKGRALLMISPVVLATAALVVLGVRVIGPRDAALSARLKEYWKAGLDTAAHTR